MNCETCLKEHDGTFASGRFCSRKCSNSFSTKFKRNEINQTVSEKLKGKPFTGSSGWKQAANPVSREKAKTTARINRQIKLDALSFDEIPMSEKRKRIISEQNFVCSLCGISREWNNKPLVFHLDHIDGNKKTLFDNRRENLRLICPNCHSQTDTYCSRNLSPEGRKKLQKKKSARLVSIG